jgi:hypothetical protein
MTIAIETEQIANRRNFLLKSIAQISDGSARRFSATRRNNCAVKSMRYHRSKQSSGIAATIVSIATARDVAGAQVEPTLRHQSRILMVPHFDRTAETTTNCPKPFRRLLPQCFRGEKHVEGNPLSTRRKMAHPRGFEPLASAFGVARSVFSAVSKAVQQRGARA